MTWTAKELLTWAASQIGTKEQPANSNHVWYWDYYKQHCGANYQGQPWCAAFVATGMSEGGLWKFTKDEGRFRYCPSIVNWAKSKGIWKPSSAKPQPGWLIIFANKGTACHVGFVEKRIDSSKVQTIEGNTGSASNDNGGAVMRRVRTYGTPGSSWYILGFVATDFSKGEGTATAKPSSPSKKTNTVIANEVIEGKWGNGSHRREKLKAAGYDPDVIQNIVMSILNEQKKPAETPKPATPASLKTGTYKITVSDGLNVRVSPKKSAAKKPYSQLTANAKQHATEDGTLKKGTEMSVVQISNDGTARVWGKIPSGWVCLRENGKMYVKKI